MNRAEMTGRKRFTDGVHSGWLVNLVEVVTWPPDGTRIASGNDNGQVSIWTAHQMGFQRRTSGPS